MVMFEEKYQEEVAALYAALEAYQRGSVITWDVIETAMGRNRRSEGGWHIVRRVRRMIQKQREIVSVPVTGIGLRFLTHKEAARTVPVRRQQRAYRQINRGLRELSTIAPDGLSDWDRMSLAKQTNNMKREKRDIGRSYRDQQKTTRKFETMPRRVAVASS